VIHQWQHGNAAAASARKVAASHKNVRNAEKKGNFQKLNKTINQDFRGLLPQAPKILSNFPTIHLFYQIRLGNLPLLIF
jgi:hypothetical protein